MLSCKSVDCLVVVNDKADVGDLPEFTEPSSYRSLIGSLLYACGTRPNIMFSISYLSRFMQTPSIQHFMAVKRILRYLKGILDFGLSYKRIFEVQLHGFSGSDYAGDSTDCKSTSGYVFPLGILLSAGIPGSKMLWLNQ
ncbi:Retrotransposon protein, unclassified, putative [Theobroma cacao]|uniref:Retrotransposon protein, unclassified, putative n=1 Tax=Theobroma cacao TaxID=3641 RepID=A0A061EBS8_THECC|nr:Retrotransposon protein, unclassified, putative [Theobroma cacao]